VTRTGCRWRWATELREHKQFGIPSAPRVGTAPATDGRRQLLDLEEEWVAAEDNCERADDATNV